MPPCPRDPTGMKREGKVSERMRANLIGEESEGIVGPEA